MFYGRYDLRIEGLGTQKRFTDDDGEFPPTGRTTAIGHSLGDENPGCNAPDVKAGLFFFFFSSLLFLSFSFSLSLDEIVFFSSSHLYYCGEMFLFMSEI